MDTVVGFIILVLLLIGYCMYVQADKQSKVYRGSSDKSKSVDVVKSTDVVKVKDNNVIDLRLKKTQYYINKAKEVGAFEVLLAGEDEVKKFLLKYLRALENDDISYISDMNCNEEVVKVLKKELDTLRESEIRPYYNKLKVESTHISDYTKVGSITTVRLEIDLESVDSRARAYDLTIDLKRKSRHIIECTHDSSIEIKKEFVCPNCGGITLDENSKCSECGFDTTESKKSVWEIKSYKNIMC